jgi:hypothetical protein
VIYSAQDGNQAFPIQNLTFKNISLSSSITPISTVLMGDGLIVNGINIQTPPTYVPNQVAGTAVLGLKATAQASVTNYTYTPLIPTYDPYGTYNYPLVGWSPSSNVTAQVTINWPSSIPLPTGKPIISPGFQDPNSNNSATTTFSFQ